MYCPLINEECKSNCVFREASEYCLIAKYLELLTSKDNKNKPKENTTKLYRDIEL